MMDCMWLCVCAFVQVERMKSKGGVFFVVVFQCCVSVFVCVCVCVECVCAVCVHDGL